MEEPNKLPKHEIIAQAYANKKHLLDSEGEHEINVYKNRDPLGRTSFKFRVCKGVDLKKKKDFKGLWFHFLRVPFSKLYFAFKGCTPEIVFSVLKGRNLEIVF